MLDEMLTEAQKYRHLQKSHTFMATTVLFISLAQNYLPSIYNVHFISDFRSFKIYSPTLYFDSRSKILEIDFLSKLSYIFVKLPEDLYPRSLIPGYPDLNLTHYLHNSVS